MKFKIADDYGLCRYIEGDGYSSFMEGDVWGFNGFAFGAFHGFERSSYVTENKAIDFIVKEFKKTHDEAKELLHKPSLGRGKTIAHLERQHPYWSRTDAMKYIGYTDEAIREYNKSLLLKRSQL